MKTTLKEQTLNKQCFNALVKNILLQHTPIKTKQINKKNKGKKNQSSKVYTSNDWFTVGFCRGGKIRTCDLLLPKQARWPGYATPRGFFLWPLHFRSMLRREGDSNPRYSYPYDSLANCWFQPLTHLSGLSECLFFRAPLSKRDANIKQWFTIKQTASLLFPVFFLHHHLITW